MNGGGIQQGATTQRPLRKVIFFLQLPEPVAIATGSTFNLPFDQLIPELQDVPLRPLAHVAPMPGRADGNMFVSYRFWQVPYRQTISLTDALDPVIRQALPPHLHTRPLEEAEREAPNFNLRRTVVEVVTPIFSLNPDEATLTEAFDRSLAGLRELETAYQVVLKVSLPDLNRHRLPFVVLYVTADLLGEEGWDDHLSLFMLHANSPVVIPRDPLSAEEMQQFGAALRRVRNNDPLMLYMERAAKARRALHQDGDYATAVIEAETAFEILLDGVLTLMLWEEQVPPETAATNFEAGLASRVRTLYHPRLGGNWRETGTGPIADWATRLAALRGRVVHAGYAPPFAEAQQAVEALSSVERFVIERLIQKRIQYMRTTLLVVGKTELERRGVFTGQVRRFAESTQEPDLLASYRQWRERFISARRAS